MKNKKLLFGIGALAVVLIAGFLVSGQFLQGAARNARGPATPPAPVTPTVLTFAASPNPVEEDKIVAGDQTAATAVLVARYQVTATGTNSSKVIISNLVIENDYNNQNPLANDAAVNQVFLHFPTSFSNPTNLNGVATATLNAAGYAEFNGLNFRIPGSTPVQFEVRVVTNPIGENVAVGDQIEMDFSPQQYTAMDRASTIVQGQVLPDGIDGPEFILIEGTPVPPAIGSLSVSLASPTTDETVVKGADDVVLATFSLIAGPIEAINVSSITVRGYMDQNVDGVFALASEAGVDFNDVVVQAHLEDSAGNVLGSPQPFASDGTATFSDGFTILSGGSQTIRVVGDIGVAGVPHGANNDSVAVDIADIDQDIVAVGAASGEPVSFSGSNYPNGGAVSLTRMIVVKNSGLITVAPSLNPVLDDKATSPNANTNNLSNPLLVARVRIFAQDEAFNVSKMTFLHGNATGAITAVVLKYPTSLSAPTTLDGIATGTLSSYSVTFNGLNVAVPESTVDENAINVELYVATAGIGMGANSGDRLDLDFDYDANFQAVGLDSGTTVTQNSNSSMYGTFANVVGNEIAIYKSIPTFERHTSSTVCPATTLISSIESEVYCFKVTATTGNAVSLYKISFDAVPTLLNNGTAVGQLANANGWKLYKYNASGNVQSTFVGSGTWVSATNTVSIILDTVNADSTVPAGGTNYYVLKAPVSFVPSTMQSNLSVRLKDDVFHVNLAPAASIPGSPNNIWSDRSAATHSALSADWTNSYKLETLPTQYFQLTE